MNDTQKVAIDEVDAAVLHLLATNARRTLADIGAHVALSAPAVKRRIDRLEALGVIAGYTVRIDYARIGPDLRAFVELRFAGNTRVNDIEGVAGSIPEVEAIFTLAGDPDAVATVRVRDVEHLKRVIDQLRASRKIVGTKTMMVLGSAINSVPIL